MSTAHNTDVERVGARDVGSQRELRLAHPRTGELLEPLDQQPPEVLAEALDALHATQALLKTTGAALETELRRRLDIRGRRLALFGDWEVSAEAGREAVWDADDAEAALRRLIDDGVLRAGELTGVITHETVVHRAEMNRVLGQLAGPAKSALEQCRTWRTKGLPRVRVTRSVSLIEPPDEPPQEEK